MSASAAVAGLGGVGLRPLVVGIGDLAVGTGSGALVTYALGSCLGITVYDPEARVGALLHVMMPASNISPEKASTNPCLFVDTGVPVMFRRSYELGAQKQRMIVKVAGGAAPASAGGDPDYFQIGKRNLVQLRKLLWKNGVLLKGEDVGGTTSRTLSLSLSTGEVLVKSGGVERPL
ncbi:MAG: chemotaxis protein CheD [Myxococcales bacterium]|nr:chemotaxis protein CheD [Myxococcales bacterium]